MPITIQSHFVKWLSLVGTYVNISYIANLDKKSIIYIIYLNWESFRENIIFLFNYLQFGLVILVFIKPVFIVPLFGLLKSSF